MKNKFLKFFILFLSFIPQILFAQKGDVEMADGMRADGKIYVVLSVIAVIFVGIIIYMVMIDRKISRLENKN